jgi:hypothetical protein
MEQQAEEDGRGGSGESGSGSGNISAAAVVAGEAPHLLDVPDAALIQVLSHLQDPLQLAFTCRHLSQLLRSPALGVLWLTRWGAAAQPWRPAAGRLLTFRPLCGTPPADLVALLLQYLEAEGEEPDVLEAARSAQRAGQVRVACRMDGACLLWRSRCSR